MPIHLPAEIASGGLVDCAGNRGEIGRHMMFETVFANVVEKVLQPRDLDDSGAAKGIQRIIGEAALANVATHFARCVIG